jgi:hypothetical protein
MKNNNNPAATVKTTTPAICASGYNVALRHHSPPPSPVMSQTAKLGSISCDKDLPRASKRRSKIPEQHQNRLYKPLQ